MASKVLTRFAPSPTGYLHIGHAFAARQAFGFAEKHGGTCLLRIEDTDFTRCKPEYTEMIYEDLRWLGFDWPEPVRVQSEHRDQLDTALEGLHKKGLIYRCFKTRKDLPEGLYRGAPDPDEAKKLSSDKPFAWRLSIRACQDYLGQIPLSYVETYCGEREVVFKIEDLADEIVARKDIGTSYLLACVHDDGRQNITHIVRGEDIAGFTPVQVLLQNIMGLPTPIYYHHDVVKNANGKKLSKRNQDTAIHALRAEGVSPQDI